MNEELQHPMIRVQVEDQEVICQAGTSLRTAETVLFSHIPVQLQPKIAILRTAGRNVHIEGIGRQALPNVFYVVTTQSEWTQLLKEANHESSTRSID